MSLKAMLWALDEAATSDPYEFAILVALADEANSEGLECFPEIRTIARRSRQSFSTVRRRLTALEDRGLIVVVRPASQGRGHHNRYGLVMNGRTPDQVRRAVESGASAFPEPERERVSQRTPSAPVKEPKRAAMGGSFTGAKEPKRTAHGWLKPDQPSATPNPPLFAGHDLPPIPAPRPPTFPSFATNSTTERPTDDR